MIRKSLLGGSGPSVSCLGYGAMVREGYYGASDDDQAAATIPHALDVGLTMLDSADAFGSGHNERFVAPAIEGRRDDAFAATKFDLVFDEGETGTELPTGWGFPLRINGRPEYVRRAPDASLARLEVNVIDLWFAHSVDPATPIEETAGARAEAVRAGKVRCLGLSNATADEARRAHAAHPISAVQDESSLWRREPEASLLPTLRELGIAPVAWSPFGSGFLTGAVVALEKNDFHQANPGASAARTWPRTATASRPSCSSRRSWTSRRRSWPWRGSCTGAATSSRSGERAGRSGSTRTRRPRGSAPAAGIRPGRKQPKRIDEIARPGLAEGATLV